MMRPERTLLVVFQRLLEIGEISLLQRTRNCTHAFYVAELRVFRCELDRQQCSVVFRLEVSRGLS